MSALPVLLSSHCILNHITDEDVIVLRQLFDDELTKKFIPELRYLVRSDKGIKRMLSSFDALSNENKGMIWGIRLGQLQSIIGFVAFIDLPHNPTIVYAMHPNYRANGYMKESVALAIQYLFGITSCDYVQTEVYNENVASIHLLLSIGFRVQKQNKKKTYLRIEARDQKLKQQQDK